MRFLPLFAVLTVSASAQSDVRYLEPVLSKQIQSPEVTSMQLRQYAMKRVPAGRVPADARTWTAQAQQIRSHLLQDVVFHGWPKEWVNAPPRFENAGTVESGDGYRTTKLRYEIVPGFFSSAILYEPLNAKGKVPAILNVNGHTGPVGKAVEYKQKRCINFAKHGIMALNLEWFGYGDLGSAENGHSYAGHLDLAGANGVGLFYLAMRKGLDYLDQHPNVDRTRLGVTGLSGGGWQTITLSALDERVSVSVPVAGFSSLTTGIEHPEYVGNDIEQNATDFRDGQDYVQLAAMRAPRPTLLIYNGEDDCCFRASIVKEGVFDNIKPYFGLFGKESLLAWHENSDPGTHNYQLDNRLQAYRFFSEQFRLPIIEKEIPVDAEIKTPEELAVSLPKDNLTILGLARKLAQATPGADAQHSGSDPAARKKLEQLIRYRPVTVNHAWFMANTKSKGVETHSYLFELSNGLSATGILVKGIATPNNAPVTIVLSDAGKKSSAVAVSEFVNRGEQVLTLDLLFTGDDSVARRVPDYAQLLASIGDRPLALRAAQLRAVADWLQTKTGAPRKRLHSTGMRSQVVSLVAAALDPAAFTEVKIQDGIPSLSFLLEKPVAYEKAPELFCLDLYKEFDLPRLAALGRR